MFILFVFALIAGQPGATASGFNSMAACEQARSEFMVEVTKADAQAAAAVCVEARRPVAV